MPTTFETRYAFVARLWERMPDAVRAWHEDVEPHFRRLFSMGLDEANTVGRAAWVQANRRWLESIGFGGEEWDWIGFDVLRYERPRIPGRPFPVWWLSSVSHALIHLTVGSIEWRPDLEESRTEARDRLDAAWTPVRDAYLDAVEAKAAAQGQAVRKHRPYRPSSKKLMHFDWLIDRYMVGWRDVDGRRVRGLSWDELVKRYKPRKRSTIIGAVTGLENALCNPS